MPETDEDILRELLHHVTDDLHAPSAVTAGFVTGQHRRQRNSRILSITVTSVAAAAVVAAVVVTRAGSSAPGHAQHPTAQHPTALPAIKLTAVQVLNRLSVAAANAPQQTGRYIALTEIRQEPAVTYPKDFKSELSNKKLPPLFRAQLQHLVKEYGYPARLVTTDRTTVFDGLTGDIWTYQHGSNVPSELPVAAHGSPTRAQFAAWPTNPAALRARLLQQGEQSMAQGEQVQGETHDDLVFQEAANWLWNPLLSAALRAAMYKVLAATSGVAVKTGTTDKTGRAAIEISRYDSVAGEESETFESPSTGAVLEQAFSDAGTDVYAAVTSYATLPANPYSGG